MAATACMVEVAKIRASEGANPRVEFEDERMAELVASVKRHGIITPLTLAPDGEGGFVIVAGERRYRAALAAKLAEVPAQVREVNGDALALAVSENLIRADLNPLEEAQAFRRLLDEHGDARRVGRLVGRSERLIRERLELLALPERTQEQIAERRVPLACVPALAKIAKAEPILADLTATVLSERPQFAPGFPSDPARLVDEVLRSEFTSEAGDRLRPVACSVGGYGGPILPGGHDGRTGELLAKLGEHAARVAEALAALPEIEPQSEQDWQARERADRRYRECFCLDEQDTDAARAYGCLLELTDGDGRSGRYVTDPAWLADRLTQKIGQHQAAETERAQSRRERAPGEGDDERREARRREQQQAYQQRQEARARNLDLGATLAQWQPKLDTDAVKLLGSLVLHEYGRPAAWAHRLCVEQPTTTSKAGIVSVRYPRGGEAEQHHHEQALQALARARSPEDALAVVLRLLVAQQLADATGLPQADRQGLQQPRQLAEHPTLARLAAKIAPASVRQQRAAAREPKP